MATSLRFQQKHQCKVLPLHPLEARGQHPQEFVAHPVEDQQIQNCRQTNEISDRFLTGCNTGCMVWPQKGLLKHEFLHWKISFQALIAHCTDAIWQEFNNFRWRGSGTWYNLIKVPPACKCCENRRWLVCIAMLYENNERPPERREKFKPRSNLISRNNMTQQVLTTTWKVQKPWKLTILLLAVINNTCWCPIPSKTLLCGSKWAGSWNSLRCAWLAPPGPLSACSCAKPSAASRISQHFSWV